MLRAILNNAQHSQKCLRPSRHSPKKGFLRHQARNLAPPRRVRAWRDGSPKHDDAVHGEPRPTATGTRSDPCTDKAKCVLVQRFPKSSAYATLCLEDGYLSRAPPNERVWYKAVFKGCLDAGLQPKRSAKNTFGSVGIPLNRGASGPK